MRRIILKFPKEVFTSTLPKVLTVRGYSLKKKPKDPSEDYVRKVMRAGAVTLTGIIISSYLILRRKHLDSIQGESLAGINSEVSLSANVVANSNKTKIHEEDIKNEETIRDKFNFIKKVVSHCAPAVFYLEIRDPFKKDLETGEPVITSNGSGFLISEDGWALTNAHVVLNKPQSTITAIMRDGKSYKAIVEDADMNMDLALLRLDVLEKMPSLDFGKQGDTNVGEWVVALGSPLSLSNSVTVGIVSSVNRPAEDLGLKNYAMTYIQTDASITFGNSGGPLVNLDGNVIGINNLRLTSGISFAIPVEYVTKFLQNSRYRIKTGDSIGPTGKTLLGITTMSITPELLTDLLRDNENIPKDLSEGLLVWKVITESPAAHCGMEVGDIITHVNGVPVKETSDLYVLSSTEGEINISVIHQGKKKTVMIDTRINK